MEKIKMADVCCHARSCVKKKKFYKRELQKWAKNVLYLVGLERVAEEVISHHRRRLKLVDPLLYDTACETLGEPTDWTPDEKCIFCVNRQDASDVCSVDSASQDEGSRAVSPAWSLASDEPLDLSVSSRARSCINGDINGTLYSTSFLKVPRIPERSGKHPKRRRPDSGYSTTIPIGGVHTSSSNCATTRGHNNCVDASADVAVAVASALAKRAYTDGELQLALQDIQEGKLGTRRASILYGIPRSTLRNKVYKMTMDNCANTTTVTKCVSSSDGNASICMPQFTVNDHAGIKNSPSSQSNTSNVGQLSASESLKRLLRNRMAERLQSNKRSEQLQKLPLLPDLIRKLSEERFEQECNKSRDRNVTESSCILKIPSYKSRSKSKSSSLETDVTHNTSQSSSCRINRSSSANSNGDSKGVGVALREIIVKSIECKPAKISSATTVNVRNQKGQLGCPSTSTSSPSTDVTSKIRLRTTNSQLDTTRASREIEGDKSTRKSSSGKRMRAKRGRYRNYDRDNLMEAVRAVRRGEMSVHRAGSYFGVPHSTLEYKVKERHLMRPKKSIRRTKRNRSTDTNTGGHYSPDRSSSKSSFVDDSTGASSSDGDGQGSNSNEDSGESFSHDGTGTLIEQAPVVGSQSTNKNKSGQRQSSARTSLLPEAVPSTSPHVSTTSMSSAAPLWPFAIDFSSLNSSNFFASQMMRKLQEDAMTHAAAAAASSVNNACTSNSSTSMINGVENNSSRARDASSLLSVLIRNGLQIQAAEAAGRK